MPFLHAADVFDYTCDIQGQGGRRASTWAILTVCLTAFVTTTDFTIINVALPAIGADLSIGIGQLQWVADAYNITLAGFLLLGAGLGDRFTHRRVFLVGVAIFTVGCLVGAGATGFPMLVGGRVLMGLGAALLLSPALALLAILCHGHERGRALGLWALMASLGFACGPLLGGLLLTVGSWRLVFLVVVPVLLVIMVVGPRALPRAQAHTSAHVDLPGALLSVLALVLLLGGLIEAPERGWTSPAVVAALAVGSIVVAVFVWWELRTPTPMVDLSLLPRRSVRAALVVFCAAYLSSAAILFIAPQQLMIVSGFSAMAVGLALLPLAVVDGFFGLRAAAWARARSRRALITVGMSGMAAGFVVLALSVTGPAVMVTVIGVVVGTCCAAVGWGLLTPLANAQLLDGVDADQAGSASGIGALSRFVGAAVGVAVFGSLLAGLYSRQILEAFARAGLPAPDMAGNPVATTTTVAMLPPQQMAQLQPQAFVAYADSVQWTYGAGAILMVVALVSYRRLSRTGAGGH